MKKKKRIIVVSIILVVSLVVGCLAFDFRFGCMWKEPVEDKENPGRLYIYEDCKDFYSETYEYAMKYEGEPYETEDGQFLVCNYKDGVCIKQYLLEEDNAEVVIPETINGKKVIKIGAEFYINEYSNKHDDIRPAFYNEYTSSSIKSIYIPKYVKEIYYLTFCAVGGITYTPHRIYISEENPYYRSIGGRIVTSKESHQILWTCIFGDVF